jgi:hypothetical protein
MITACSNQDCLIQGRRGVVHFDNAWFLKTIFPYSVIRILHTV